MFVSWAGGVGGLLLCVACDDAVERIETHLENKTKRKTETEPTSQKESRTFARTGCTFCCPECFTIDARRGHPECHSRALKLYLRDVESHGPKRLGHSFVPWVSVSGSGCCTPALSGRVRGWPGLWARIGGTEHGIPMARDIWIRAVLEALSCQDRLQMAPRVSPPRWFVAQLKPTSPDRAPHSTAHGARMHSELLGWVKW